MDIEAVARILKLRRPKIFGENMMACCPFEKTNHAGGIDSNRSFGINIYTTEWNCFACKEKGKSVRSLADKLEILLPHDLMLEALSLEYDSIKTPKVESVKSFFDEKEVEDFIKNSTLAYAMLKYRGISLPAIKRFKVGYNSRNKSIVFPVFDDKQRLLGWMERNENWENRYAFRPEKVNRKYFLFGLDRPIKKAYLVEGPVDMLKLVSWHKEAIATCGNSIFEEQAKELLQKVDEIVLVPDQDAPGKLWLKDATKYLKGKIPLKIIEVAQLYKDVGHKDLKREEFESYKEVNF